MARFAVRAGNEKPDALSVAMGSGQAQGYGIMRHGVRNGSKQLDAFNMASGCGIRQSRGIGRLGVGSERQKSDNLSEIASFGCLGELGVALNLLGGGIEGRVAK